MKNNQINKLIKNSPQLPDIQERRKYLNSAVFIPFILIDNEYHLLFEKRSKNIKQGGDICFPGGKYDIKQDTCYKHTAIRETVEELGVKRDKILIKGRLDTVVAQMGAIIEVFFGILDINSLDELNINEEEVEKAFTIPLSYFENIEPQEYEVKIEFHPSYINENGKKIDLLPSKELGLPEIYHNSWTGKPIKVNLYKYDNDTIWGITANIIKDLIKFIKL